jgi:hypothetical protein
MSDFNDSWTPFSEATQRRARTQPATMRTLAPSTARCTAAHQSFAPASRSITLPPSRHHSWESAIPGQLPEPNSPDRQHDDQAAPAVPRLTSRVRTKPRARQRCRACSTAPGSRRMARPARFGTRHAHVATAAARRTPASQQAVTAGSVHGEGPTVCRLPPGRAHHVNSVRAAEFRHRHRQGVLTKLGALDLRNPLRGCLRAPFLGVSPFMVA